MEKINPVKAVAKNNPQIIYDVPIFRKFLYKVKPSRRNKYIKSITEIVIPL